MNKTVTLEGVTKPVFSYIGTIPTIGNKQNVFTGLITHRSGNEERTRLIAEEAQEYVKNQLARDIWDLLGYDEASTVLAPELIQKVGMSHFDLDSDEDDDVEDIVMTFTVDVQPDNEEMSRASAWGGGSAMTTQSTRDKLTAAEAQHAVVAIALQSEQAEREAAEVRVAAQDLLLQQQAEAMEALMLYLAAARTTDQNPSLLTPPSPTTTPQDSPSIASDTPSFLTQEAATNSDDSTGTAEIHHHAAGKGIDPSEMERWTWVD